MPRLPTIRVIGSHAISTRPVSCALPTGSFNVVIGSPVSPGRPEAGREFFALVAPPGLGVDGVQGYRSQPADQPAVRPARRGRDHGPGRLVHERHELVREPGHGAGDADAADVRTAADAVDPPPLRYVALHH